MKKFLLFVMIGITMLLMSCTSKNDPVRETGSLCIENKCSYYATANVFLVEGDTEKEVLVFDIPAEGSVTQTLETGKYRVFARCRTSLYFISENFTLTKNGLVTLTINK